MNYKYLMGILFLCLLGLVGVWGDTNGVWHHAKDVRGGIIGEDEQPQTSYYRFINPVYFNETITASSLVTDALTINGTRIKVKEDTIVLVDNQTGEETVFDGNGSGSGTGSDGEVSLDEQGHISSDGESMKADICMITELDIDDSLGSNPDCDLSRSGDGEWTIRYDDGIECEATCYDYEVSSLASSSLPDDCSNGQVLVYQSGGFQCEDMNTSSSPSCTDQSYRSCYNGDVYWYDSCNERGNRVSSCSYGCSGGSCNSPPSTGSPSPAPDPEPVGSLSITPEHYFKLYGGDSYDGITIRWSSSNAENCRLDGPDLPYHADTIGKSGEISFNGLTQEVSTYRLTCENGDKESVVEKTIYAAKPQFDLSLNELNSEERDSEVYADVEVSITNKEPALSAYSLRCSYSSPTGKKYEISSWSRGYGNVPDDWEDMGSITTSSFDVSGTVSERDLPITIEVTCSFGHGDHKNIKSDSLTLSK